MENSVKTIAKILKDVTIKALLPQIIIGIIALIINWINIGIWSAIKFSEFQTYVSIIIILVCVVLPIFIYFFRGSGLFFKKAYMIVHQEVITDLIKEFSLKITDEIFKKTSNLEQNKPLIINRLKEWIKEKSITYPSRLKKVINFALKRIPLYDEIETIANNKNDNQEFVSTEIFNRLNTLVIDTVENAFPFWLSWLIPINLIIMLVIWFV